MMIAVTYDQGEIFQHFGHTEQFKLYEIDNGIIVKEQVMDAGAADIPADPEGTDADTATADRRGSGQRLSKEPGIRQSESDINIRL